jgi:cap1 methyltransferase
MSEESFFIVPRVFQLELKIIKRDRGKIIEKLGFDEKLFETRNKIASIPYSSWLSIRKGVNGLELPFDNTKINKPVSRSFFKLLEIIKDNDISIEGDTLHLAESPGGFIEATKYIKTKRRNNVDNFYTFSLIDKKAPTYNKVLCKSPDIKILSNFKNRGDLYSNTNVKYLTNTLSIKNIHFITNDGGIDELEAFDSKEQLHHRLIFNQILTSICVLKNGGCMVLKVFDIFTELTFDFIYLLSYLFGEVKICKPATSRPTNSEKYIVCKYYDKRLLTLELKEKLMNICLNNVESISSFVDKKNVSVEFVQNIKNINQYFTKYQIYHINNIIQIYELNLTISDKQESLKSWVDRYY